jgi:hypothetical protein
VLYWHGQRFTVTCYAAIGDVVVFTNPLCYPGIKLQHGHLYLPGGADARLFRDLDPERRKTILDGYDDYCLPRISNLRVRMNPFDYDAVPAHSAAGTPLALPR